MSLPASLPYLFPRRERPSAQLVVCSTNQAENQEAAVPLVRIDLPEGRSADYRRAVGDVIYEAIVGVLNAPKDDRFMVITGHPADGLDIDPSYLGIQRTADAIVIQVTLNEGRDVAMKRAFYQAVADGLHERVGLRREDVFISLVEVKKENWSFGNGEAQYAQ
jgi:4-oxalocrotonate tautomerase